MTTIKTTADSETTYTIIAAVRAHVSRVSDEARQDMAAGRWDEVMADALYAACGAEDSETMQIARQAAEIAASEGGPLTIGRTYTATLDTGATVTLPTITAARAWATSHGSTADRCTVTDRRGRIVAIHVRDRNRDGRRWYRASL